MTSCCDYCGSAPVDPDRDAPKLLLCAGCRVAKYCSAKCQVAHWKAHRPACLASDADRTRQLASIDSELAALLADLPGGAPSRTPARILVPQPAASFLYDEIEYSFASPPLPAAVAAKVRALAQRALSLKDEAAAYRLFHLAGSPPDPGELLGSCGGGDAEAQLQAGQMLLRRGGRGTELEEDTARLCVAALWLRYASSQGHSGAGEALCGLNAAPSQPSDPPLLRSLLLHWRRHGLLSGPTQPTAAERAEAAELLVTMDQVFMHEGVAPAGPLANARTRSEQQAVAQAQAARAAAKAAAKAKADARALEQARAREEVKAARAKKQGRQ